MAPLFSLAPYEGFFRGLSDPGWAITVALDDLGAVAALAENLRVRFDQEGVGIEAYGRYLRCHSACGVDELLAQLQGLAHGFFPAYFQTRFTMPAMPPTWPDRFAIVTAWATTGETWAAGRNEAADENLRQLLVQRGLEHHRITGESPDGNHSEPGWLVVTELEDAVKLGRTHLQDAIYWVDRGHLSVVSCRDGRGAPVGIFRERVRMAAA